MNLLTSTAAKNILSIPRHEDDKEVARELLADIQAGRVMAVPLIAMKSEMGTLAYEVRGTDLIIHAIFSHYAECDMTKFGAELAEKIRVEKNCRFIRCDTRRAGLIKKLLEHGWGIDSVALVKQN